jgi:hypothetical protein
VGAVSVGVGLALTVGGEELDEVMSVTLEVVSVAVNDTVIGSAWLK